MALFFYTGNAQGLLSHYRAMIAGGHVDTWIEDKDGDFTHKPPQYIYKSWLHPYVEASRLVFGIIGPTDVGVKTSIYGIYHGRMIESFLNHCDRMFSDVQSSAMLDPYYDDVSSAPVTSMLSGY